ncbi:kinesin-domain-containing protein [Acephala macrosclerotiorum]|nr:kinesin-domain-containing protein [Acephala macrosclerotiorum]
MRTSQLPRPPSQIPSFGKSQSQSLAEISESESNARSKLFSKMAPPNFLKHKISAADADEPDPKRKTLVERAGEPRSIAAPTPSSRSHVKATSLVGASKPGHGRNPSFTSSISSSRTPSATSRNTSNSSYASSIGPASRPASAYGNRAPTSMGFSQSTTTRPTTGIPKSRPVTSIENYSDDEDDPAQGKRKGMQPLTSLPSSYALPVPAEGFTIRNRKLRGHQSMTEMRSPTKFRDVSVSTAMSMLSIDEEVKSNRPQDHQARSWRAKPPSKSISHKPSISTGMRNMKIQSAGNEVVLYQGPGEVAPVCPKTPSHIPVPSKVEAFNATPTPRRNPKPSPSKTPFLSKESGLTQFTGWDVNGRLENMEAMYTKLQETLNGSSLERSGLEEAVKVFKARIAELETIRTQLSSSNQTLQSDLDAMRQKANMLQERLLTLTTSLDDQIRASRNEMDEARREHRNEIDQVRRSNADELDRLLRAHREELQELERRAAIALEDRTRELERRNDSKLEDERSRRLREIQDLESRITTESQNLDIALQQKDREIQNMRGELEEIRGELDREQTLKGNVQNDLAALREAQQKTGIETSTTIQSLEATVSSLRARIHFLESGSKAQSDSFAEMESRLQDAMRSAETSKAKLIKEETLRRILFNQVQELKGNIRVMCRVRPVFDTAEGDSAKLKYPDTDKEGKELEVLGKEEKSSLGNITRKTHSFTFDRVFGPESQNQEVFEEISQLVQSALDGYNVCIFCYGQTGSGKTHTMSSADGMIPRATHQIYETATNLKEKGWTYTMEGSFVEVYNEEIHDLLGSSKDFDKKKHEIRHDDQKKQTTVTGLKTVTLDSADTVETILKQAANNRSVAATKSNERSSRSHSVFILKLVGHNSTTNETSVGTLNLVDLAGSERLKSSGAEGDRMKETQNINKSLSCLGDVIGALGQGKEGAHIPYRNSKLTYLLQYSLGGNSKTLMFVMASPLEAHLQETLTSLKFATKVHNTHIGTAKKQKQVRDRTSES